MNSLGFEEIIVQVQTWNTCGLGMHRRTVLVRISQKGWQGITAIQWAIHQRGEQHQKWWRIREYRVWMNFWWRKCQNSHQSSIQMKWCCWQLATSTKENILPLSCKRSEGGYGNITLIQSYFETYLLCQRWDLSKEIISLRWTNTHVLFFYLFCY